MRLEAPPGLGRHDFHQETILSRTETGALAGEHDKDLSRNNRKIAVESLNKNGNVQDLINFVNEKITVGHSRGVTDGKYDLPRDRILLQTNKRKVVPVCNSI